MDKKAQSFKVIKTKNCRKYLKKVYALPLLINKQFMDYFNDLGNPEIFSFKQFNAASHDMFRIRNYDMAIELAGGMESSELQVIFSKKDKAIVQLVEERISSWLQTSTNN